MESIIHSDKVMKDCEVLKWASEHRSCRISEVPNWVIMTLLEDIANYDCHLVEQLVRQFDNSHSWVTEEHYLDRLVEKFMNNILIASLYEDGLFLESQDVIGEIKLFELQNGPQIQVDLDAFMSEDDTAEKQQLPQPHMIASIC
ncbi:MAG: hypothetical protein JRJ12_11175 [Deltaproteobacteria bacterium]|nr:hypothetical protein [Deltaproteobacteria bacterium]MBW2072810.1 hypothetical protein [Deltaproteobacteria bacterium]